MTIKETSSFFGLVRRVDLTPSQVESLMRDMITARFHPDILKGRINADGSATVKGHVLSKDIMYILDAAVEGGVFS